MLFDAYKTNKLMVETDLKEVKTLKYCSKYNSSIILHLAFVSSISSLVC